MLKKWLLAFALLALLASLALAENIDRAARRAQGDKAIHDLIYPWPFGRGEVKVADSDGDGVPNDKDACPGTPAGVKVDAKGCPMAVAGDSDGDGVADAKDACPGTPAGARVDARGCPLDGDRDGVPDGIDQCANTPAGATVDAHGCSLDGDRDGVADGIDQCANTPAGATVDAKGCPADADGDGVYDGIDQCANTPAGVAVNKKGCPEKVTETETKFLDTGTISSSAILFDTNKATIKRESYPALQEIGNILVQWPQLKIEIGGHTDSSGPDDANLRLSQARAQAVLDYLKANFPKIEGGQYTVKGYGETKPIADNATAEGRQTNRRVEFSVLNKDELRKGADKRR